VVSGHVYLQAALPSWRNACTHWVRGWVVPRADLDGFGEGKNLLPVAGFEPMTVGSRCTDYTVKSLLNVCTRADTDWLVVARPVRVQVCIVCDRLSVAFGHYNVVSWILTSSQLMGGTFKTDKRQAAAKEIPVGRYSAAQEGVWRCGGYKSTRSGGVR
jgi:hypothetical protein